MHEGHKFEPPNADLDDGVTYPDEIAVQLPCLHVLGDDALRGGASG